MFSIVHIHYEYFLLISQYFCFSKTKRTMPERCYNLSQLYKNAVLKNGKDIIPREEISQHSLKRC